MTILTSVHWSVRSRLCLHQAFEQQRLLALESELLLLYTRLLVHLFPNQTVFVYWRAGGFDPCKLQHALLVEAFDHSTDSAGSIGGTNESHIAVVKIGLEKNILTEASGWKAVCPPGIGNDSVLLGLHYIAVAEADSSGRLWEAVLYEDANQKIGAAEVVTLEAAVTGACLSDVPSYQSVSDCIVDVYQRLEQHFYAAAVEEGGRNTSIEQRIVGLFYPPHSKPSDRTADIAASSLGDRLARWRAEDRLRRPRVQVNLLLRELTGTTSKSKTLLPRDPVQAIEEVAAVFKIALGETDVSAAARKWLDGWLPTLMRGKTHGDLHARNILVGLYDNGANFPVVFDYEHTGTDKLIAWDFIKLEFETKTRVLVAILGSVSLCEFGKEVIRFEQRLWDATEHDNWDAEFPAEPSRPLDRLFHLMLTLRRCAAFSLAAEQARTGSWSEEYKFLCAMYATMGAKYDYGDRQRIATLLSGACAVGRSRWSEQLNQWETNRWQAVIRDNTWATAAIIGWEKPVEIAQYLRGTNNPDQLDQAKSILERVVESFPHIAQAWEDLILVCLNQKQTDAAYEHLEQALRVVEKTEELMCRFGRIEKDLGLVQFGNQNWSAAAFHFDRAFEFYQQAHSIQDGHYPAINMSSIRLHHSVAEQHLIHPERSELLLQEAQAIAQRLLETRDTWPITQPQDPLWHLATEAEANSLVGNHDRATQLYQQAATHPLITPEAWKSIESQRERNEALAVAIRTRERK